MLLHLQRQPQLVETAAPCMMALRHWKHNHNSRLQAPFYSVTVFVIVSTVTQALADRIVIVVVAAPVTVNSKYECKCKHNHKRSQHNHKHNPIHSYIIRLHLELATTMTCKFIFVVLPPSLLHAYSQTESQLVIVFCNVILLCVRNIRSYFLIIFTVASTPASSNYKSNHKRNNQNDRNP